MTEFQLHTACAQFLDLALPRDAVWFHTPNAGKRRKGAAGRLKAMGMKAGVPDICIIYRGRAFFIELKTLKGRLSEAQKAMHIRLTVAGAIVAGECRSLDDLQAFLQQVIPLRLA